MKFKNFLKFIYYCILLILTIAYIFYRIFFTLPTKLGMISLFFAILVLLVEIWEAFDFFIYYLNILIEKKNSPSIPTINIQNSEYPDIDIFIATINESEPLLTNTILACQNMDYPQKDKIHIYLCDDGNRLNIKKLADSMNINYITRSNTKNAKSGNYNNALHKTPSPYIVTFDADMAPEKNFLLKTIPFFLNSKEKVGFVQTPQSFNNPDIFQYRFRLEKEIPFEQDYFYHTLQIAKNNTNSTVCCGTNVMFSRQALLDINGFALRNFI